MRKTKKLYSKEEIDKRVKKLADVISQDYRGKELVVIGVLKGAFIFMADLIRYFYFPCIVDFVKITSYGSGMISSENIKITKDIEIDIEGKDVLVVEDIIDTGLTLSFLVDRLKKRNPQSLKTCVFLDKKSRGKTKFEVDYVGFSIGGEFVIGYGLDYNEKYRNLSGIYKLRKG